MSKKKKTGKVTRRRIKKVKKKTNKLKKKIKETKKIKVKKIRKTIKFTRKVNKPKPSVPVIETGIKGLDALLGGGIPESTTFLLFGIPHCGKKPALMRMAHNSFKNKKPILFVLTDFGVDGWKNMMKRSNWSVDRHKKFVYFVDCYSKQFGIEPSGENISTLDVPYTLSSLSIEVTNTIKKIEFETGKKPIVILHSISTLLHSFGDLETFKFLQFFIGKLRTQKITFISSMQSGSHHEEVTSMIITLIDGIMEMRDNYKLRLRGYSSIKSRDWVDYTITKRGLSVEYKQE